MSPGGCLRHGGKRRLPLKNEWLNRFKVSLIEKDLKSLECLHREMPVLETPAELEEAKMLIKQAIELFQSESIKVKATMDQMKKALHFNRASRSGSRSKFDKSY